MSKEHYNKDQLAELKKGPKSWNQWRDKNKNATINLAGANLDGWDLHGANLNHANLEKAHLCDAIMTGAHLNGAILTGARLMKAKMKAVELHSANLNGADLTGATGLAPGELRVIKKEVNKGLTLPNGETYYNWEELEKSNFGFPVQVGETKAAAAAAKTLEAHHSPQEPIKSPHPSAGENGDKEEKPVDLLAQSVPVATPAIQEPPPRPVTIAPKPKRELPTPFGNRVTPGEHGSTSIIIGGGTGGPTR